MHSIKRWNAHISYCIFILWLSRLNGGNWRRKKSIFKNCVIGILYVYPSKIWSIKHEKLVEIWAKTLLLLQQRYQRTSIWMSGKLSNTIHHIFQVQRREKRTFRYDKCFFAILLVRTRVVWLKNGARIPVAVVRNSAKISHVTLSHWHGGIVACHVTARRMRSWVTVGLHSVYFVSRAS